MSAGAVGRAVGGVARTLILWALVAAVFWIAVLIAPDFELPSFWAALMTTGLVVVINTVLWPLLIRVVLPLTVLSFGLLSLMLNAGTVALAVRLVDGDAPPLLACLVAAFILSVSLMLLA